VSPRRSTGRPLVAAWAEAPAKVNLGLAIMGRREDGYHRLRSVFLRLALHDHLEVRAAADSSREDELVVEGDPGLSVHDNLVLRAVACLRAAQELRGLADGSWPALRFRLDKHIPTAAGLAGGSSDAAAALALAAGAWGLSPGRATLLEVAGRLGADVPFFAAAHGVALVSGVGEVIESLPEPWPPPGVLLVTTAERLSTAAVFAEFDRGAAPPGGDAAGVEAVVDQLAVALRGGLDGAALADLADGLRDANDLWPAAARLSPGLTPAREALESRLDRAILLTGSGPTLLAVYPSLEAAAAAAAELEQDRPPALAGATILATSGSSRGGSP
jgi:4-diphosphocytidyl-2-C-methyl-D-erythritol kinase